MDLFGSLVFLLIMLLVVNVGALVRLRFFNNVSWKTVKKILLIANILLFGFYLVYFFILRKGECSLNNDTIDIRQVYWIYKGD
jgi:carbon starvation protein CstA